MIVMAALLKQADCSLAAKIVKSENVQFLKISEAVPSVMIIHVKFSCDIFSSILTLKPGWKVCGNWLCPCKYFHRSQKIDCMQNLFLQQMFLYC